MAVVKNLMVRCGADFSALTKATTQAKSSISSMSRSTQKATTSIRQSAGSMQKSVSTAGKSASSAFSGIGKAIKAAGITVAVRQIVTGLAGLTKEAMSVDAQVSNLGRTMGSSQAAFMNWAKTSAAAFGISESAAVQYGNAYSNLLSGFISDTAASTAYTKQLIETSAVIASRTGRTVEDVSERIRSGLLGNTEAIEDLGVNVNVALLETTDAFHRLANGRSWQQLTFQEQQQVRLFAILEQSADKFGDSLAGGGSTSLMGFSAQLSNLKLELGRAFAPLAETVIPLITQLVGAVADAVRWVNSLFAALRGQPAGESVQAAAESAGQAAASMETLTAQTEEAGEAAKGALAGFDDLSVLTQPAASGTADTAPAASPVPALETGGLDVPAIDTSGAEAAAKRIKDAFSDVAQSLQKKFAPAVSAWGKAFEGLKKPALDAFARVRDSASAFWDDTLAPLGGYLTGEFVPTVANAFSGTFAPIFGDVMPVLFDTFSADFAFACGEAARVTNDILTPAFEQYKTVAVGVFDGVKKAWDEHGAGILEGFTRFKESLRELWDTIYENIIKPIFDRIAGTVSWLWDKHLKPLWDKLTDFFGSVAEFLLALWNERIKPVVDFIVTTVGPVVSHVVGTIGDVVGTVIGVVSDVIGGILEALGGLMDFLTGVFTGDWEKAWSGIQQFFKGIWDGIWGIVKGIVNLIIDGLNLLWGAIYSVVAGIVNGIGGIAEVIGSLFGQDWGFSMPAEPPLIPKLAAGGLAVGPTLALIGEGSDREAVLPLNPGVYAEIARGIQDAGSSRETVILLQGILDAVLQINPTLVLDGTTLAKASTGYFEAEQKRRGPSVVRVV